MTNPVERRDVHRTEKDLRREIDNLSAVDGRMVGTTAGAMSSLNIQNRVRYLESVLERRHQAEASVTEEMVTAFANLLEHATRHPEVVAHPDDTVLVLTMSGYRIEARFKGAVVHLVPDLADRSTVNPISIPIDGLRGKEAARVIGIVLRKSAVLALAEV